MWLRLRMTPEKKKRIRVATLIAVAALALLAFARFKEGSDIRLLEKNGTRADAVVLDTRIIKYERSRRYGGSRTHVHTEADASFDGLRRWIRVPDGTRVGDHFPILYDKTDPKVLMIENDPHRRGRLRVPYIGAFFVVLIWGGFVVWEVFRND